MVNTDGIRHWCDSVEETFNPREKVPRGEEPRQVSEKFLACGIRYLRATASELDRAIAEVRDKRIDAENPARDLLTGPAGGGIKMLRTWLRGLHMDLIGGWDQDTPQDRIAELLGEHPREHERAFKVNPAAQEIRGLPSNGRSPWLKAKP